MRGVFDALGDPTRRRILELVSRDEHTVGAIVEALREETSISQPAVSQHLRTLREAHLVRARAEGKHRYYALDEAGLDIAQTWLAHLSDPLGAFAQPLDALATELVRGRRERRRADHDPAELAVREPDDRTA